jgi:hypothetical protein
MGNLRCHTNDCSPANSHESRALAAYTSGSKYTEASHRMKLVLWVARYNRPFTIVEDKLLIEIFTDLNPNCLTRSRHMVLRDIKEIFMLSRKEVGGILRVSNLFFHSNCCVMQSIFTEASWMASPRSRRMDLPQCYRIHWCNNHVGPRWQNYFNHTGLH